MKEKKFEEGSLEEKKFDKLFVPDPIIVGKRIYTLTKLKDCARNKLIKTSEGYARSEETEPGLRFVFKDKSRKSWVCHTLAKGVSEKSGLFKFLQRCYDSLLTKEVVFKHYTTDSNYTGSVCQPEGRLIELAHLLVGSDFELDVSLKYDKYAKIESISPVGDVRHEPKAAATEPIQDDIDFGNVSNREAAESEANAVDDDDFPY
jgi:hypothetical protein